MPIRWSRMLRKQFRSAFMFRLSHTPPPALVFGSLSHSRLKIRKKTKKIEIGQLWDRTTMRSEFFVWCWNYVWSQFFEKIAWEMSDFTKNHSHSCPEKFHSFLGNFDLIVAWKIRKTMQNRRLEIRKSCGPTPVARGGSMDKAPPLATRPKQGF